MAAGIETAREAPASGAADRRFRPRALGEIAIRCADLAAMTAFNGEVLGLERLAGDHGDGIVFFALGEGFGGHSAVLALFGRDAPGRPGLHPSGPEAPCAGAGFSLHHLALSLPAAEQEAAIAWLDALGRLHRVEVFGWVGWRGVFTEDPDGNTVELVAFDPSFRDPAEARAEGSQPIAKRPPATSRRASVEPRHATQTTPCHAGRRPGEGSPSPGPAQREETPLGAATTGGRCLFPPHPRFVPWGTGA